MAIVVPDEALINLNTRLFANPSPSDLTLHLFKTSLTLSSTTVLADLTAAEADYSGYSSTTMTGAASDSINDCGDVFVWDEATFTCEDDATPNLIYGYWVEGDGLLWCESLPSPVSMADTLDKLTLTAKFTLGQSDCTP